MGGRGGGGQMGISDVTDGDLEVRAARAGVRSTVAFGGYDITSRRRRLSAGLQLGSRSLPTKLS